MFLKGAFVMLKPEGLLVSIKTVYLAQRGWGKVMLQKPSVTNLEN